MASIFKRKNANGTTIWRAVVRIKGYPTVCNHEILHFMDQERGFVLHQSLLSIKTNHCAETFSYAQWLKTFCDQVLFPSHSLIVRPNKSNKKTFSIEDVQTYDVFKKAFLKCCRLSDDGNALVETNSAHIWTQLAWKWLKNWPILFAKRLATPYPLCYNAGWGE